DLSAASEPAQLKAGDVTLARLKALKRSARSALEEVGVNVVSAEYQTAIQKLAYVATLATPRSYFCSLKALEKHIPEPISAAGEELENRLRGKRLLLHQNVPLVPMGSLLLYSLALFVFGPIVLAAMLLNAPPLAAGFLAGKKFPDDINVISLWRVLIGIPVFILWMGFIGAACIGLGHPFWLLPYAVLTWTGLQLYYRVKKLTVAVFNGLRFPELRPVMLKFRETVVSNLPDDPLAALETSHR
ncbi:MAG TPA: hypothetical protein VHI52_09620, partial [Verrucomicrobiae bacterium]|nr:hypothetical protein [Verrucomicrobiae bacterium]